MLDVERQLQAYFDEVVERVTDEDVRIRASTAWGVRLPERRLRLAPVAAGAVGFGLAMTLLGIVLVTTRLFGADVTDSTSGTGIATPGGSVSAWIVVPIVLGIGLLIAGFIFMRRIPDTNQGGDDMQTMEQVESAESSLKTDELALRKRNRILGWLSGFLAVVVVGFGVWLMAELTSGSSDLAPSPEIEQLLTEYREAWINADREAYLALLTDEYTIATDTYGTFTGPGQAAVFVPGRQGLQVLSDYTVIGDGPWYVTVANHHDSVPVGGFATGADSVSVMKIVDEGGTLKIDYHRSFGPAFG